MRFLLDTHTLYWFIEGDAKLSNTAAAVIGEPTNTILFSPASYWEMAIKISLGKWQLNQPYSDFIDIALVNYGFEILNTSPRSYGRVAEPALPPSRSIRSPPHCPSDRRRHRSCFGGYAVRCVPRQANVVKRQPESPQVAWRRPRDSDGLTLGQYGFGKRFPNSISKSPSYLGACPQTPEIF